MLDVGEPESDELEPELESDELEPEPESDELEPEPESDELEPELESDELEPELESDDSTIGAFFCCGGNLYVFCGCKYKNPHSFSAEVGY